MTMKSRALRSAAGKDTKNCYVQLKRIDKLIEKHKNMPVKKVGSATTSNNSSIISRSSALKKVTTSTKKEVLTKTNIKTAQKMPTEDLGRSKRTPKPNRKYIDNSIKSIESLASEDNSDQENDSDKDSTEDLDGDTIRRQLRSSKTEPVKQTTEDKLPKRGTGRPPKITKQAPKRKIDYEDITKELPKRKRVRKDSDEEFKLSVSEDESDHSIMEVESSTSSPPTKAPSLTALPTRSGTSRLQLTKALNKIRTTSLKVPTTKISPLSSRPLVATPKTKSAIQYPEPESTPQSKVLTKPSVIMKDLEDFEQMPTFTIVNINDIINQKEEVVVIEKGTIEVDGKQTLADSGDDLEAKLAKIHGSNNRRKAQHTVRTDRIAKVLPTTSPVLLLPNLPTRESSKPYRNIIGGKNGKFKDEIAKEKLPPRILNSTLCKNTNSEVITPIVSNTNVVSSPVKTKLSNKNRKLNEMAKTNNNNNNVLKMSPAKENIKRNSAGINVGTSQINRMKESCTETMMGNRRIRKITCFETWYVIKFPPCPAEVQKTQISFSLIKLGNDIKEVKLPTANWSYKISLQRIYKDIDDDAEIYTGEVQDSQINPIDKHLYQPLNIMFRRTCQNNDLRMQFDRAIIFKNHSFSVHIDGKNVKLIGAPQYLHNFTDIEVLLQIVDNIDLENPCIEQSALIK